MTELDDDQRRAMRFLQAIPREGLCDWFQSTEIGRAALKSLGRKLARSDERRADDSEA